jgi:hypothetical protein
MGGRAEILSLVSARIAAFGGMSGKQQASWVQNFVG